MGARRSVLRSPIRSRPEPDVTRVSRSRIADGPSHWGHRLASERLGAGASRRGAGGRCAHRAHHRRDPSLQVADRRTRVLGAILGALATKFIEPTYEARAKLWVLSMNP